MSTSTFSAPACRSGASASPTELDRVDALVIPGGESTTMDKLVRGFDLYEPLRERIKRGLPVLGSCAGMIMLADRIVDAPPGQQTLGGLDVTVASQCIRPPGRVVRSRHRLCGPR